MRGTGKSKRTVHIIACGVFRPALEHLRLESRYPDIRLTYLLPVLHLRPIELSKSLKKEITAAKKNKERVICLYGECFPGISDYCLSCGTGKVPGACCWEMLLGRQRFQDLLEENPGTFFLEKELVLNFKDYCMEPLELYDREIREQYFQHYHRLLYVRQPADPDLAPKAGELAQFLGLALEVEDADYSYLEKEISELLKVLTGGKDDPKPESRN